MQMADLTAITSRVHKDWFQRHLVNPAGFNPGTRMPGFGVLAGELDDDANRQIDAIWTYLAGGRRALPPKGLDRKSVELVVGGETLLYRGKFRHAGWRGIAVGFPDLVHCAFDAEELNLATIWKGRFLNVGPHWTSQGSGRIGPLGHDRIELIKGAPFARLAQDQSPWPLQPSKELGYRFVGYEIGKLNRPTFLYAYDGVEIEDAPVGVDDGEGPRLNRRLSVSGKGRKKGLWFRVAAARNIKKLAAGVWKLDDRLEIRVGGTLASQVQLRAGAKGQELILPIPPGDEMTKILMEYRW